MPYAITVPDSYGYTVFIALVLTPALSIAQGAIVTELRKPAGVAYPNAYATAQQMKASPAAYKFNCAQRAHANLLENMPQTMMGMLITGLVHPQAAMYLGGAWWLCRVLYAFGYISRSGDGEQGKGRGRIIGGGFWIAQLALMGLSVKVALGLL